MHGIYFSLFAEWTSELYGIALNYSSLRPIWHANLSYLLSWNLMWGAVKLEQNVGVCEHWWHNHRVAAWTSIFFFSIFCIVIHGLAHVLQTTVGLNERRTIVMCTLVGMVMNQKNAVCIRSWFVAKAQNELNQTRRFVHEPNLYMVHAPTSSIERDRSPFKQGLQKVQKTIWDIARKWETAEWWAAPCCSTIFAVFTRNSLKGLESPFKPLFSALSTSDYELL